MITAPYVIWDLCGRPPVAGCCDVEQVRCWQCGGPTTRGMPREGWIGANYVNQNRAVASHSPIVCEPCVWVCARLSPVPGRPPNPGKQYGGNFRNYSHLWESGGAPVYQTASKGERGRIRAFLRRRHVGSWFAALAESGQKHVLPWTPCNPPSDGRGRLQFDELRVPVSPATDGAWGLLDAMAGLMDLGCSRSQIDTGLYAGASWKSGAGLLRVFETAWGSRRGSAWWRLCLWLADPSEEETHADPGTARDAETPDRGRDLGGETGLPAVGSISASALGPASGPDAGRGKDMPGPAGVGDATAERPPARAPGPRQLSLL